MLDCDLPGDMKGTCSLNMRAGDTVGMVTASSQPPHHISNAL